MIQLFVIYLKNICIESNIRLLRKVDEELKNLNDYHYVRYNITIIKKHNDNNNKIR